MSVKVCGRDESNEQKGCVNGGYASVSLVRMPGGRPKGTSSMDHIMEKDSSSMEKNTNMNGLENVNGQEKMKEDQLEGETQKRMPVDGNVLLQWGHRKRSRCSRPESKHGMDDSLPLPKKTTRVDSRVVKVEKQSAVSMNHDTLRPCSRAPLEFRSSSGRRNGQDSTVPIKGISINNKNCISNDIKQRHSFPSITEKPDTHAPTAHRNSTVSACLLSTDNGESPDNIFDIVVVHGGGTGMKRIPFASHKVDLDSFEWPRIFISLSRKEKEDDFYAIKGCKLPQRPKRRPKAVEKALHNCCPGNWLSDLTRGRYDVREKKYANKKKPRGLKAMESSDSGF